MIFLEAHSRISTPFTPTFYERRNLVGRKPTHSHDNLLRLHPGTCESLICDLRSLVRIRTQPEAGGIIQFYHLSCVEFLQDKSRAKSLYVTQAQIKDYLVKRLLVQFTSSATTGEPVSVIPNFFCFLQLTSLIAISIIEKNQGSFARDEEAWLNRTSLSLVGDLLPSTNVARKEIAGALVRFTNEKGWTKLRDWINLASE